MPSRVKKEKPPLPICEFCLKPITRKVEDAGGKVSCFKCFVLYRQQLAKERKSPEQEILEKAVTRMKTKKFYCAKCKEWKNDFDVNWTMLGVFCIKCNRKLWLFQLKKYLKNINYE